MPIHRSLGGPPSLLVLLALGATVHVQAQVFKSAVEVVPLTVTVTDAKGEYVKNLVETDFAVLEEGVRQSLAFFANEPVPIDLALTIDASASMASQLPIVRKAAGALVDSLRGGDRATVVTIKNTVGVALPLTADRPRIDAAIRDLSASGLTALYDGVYVVLKELERARTAEMRRRVLVLLSDGLDTASGLGADDLLALARRAGVGIYVIAMPTRASHLPRNRQDRIRVAGGVCDARPGERHWGPIVLPEEGWGAAGHLPRNRTRAREPVRARVPSVTVSYSRKLPTCDSPRGKRHRPYAERVLCGSGFHRVHTARSVSHGGARPATLTADAPARSGPSTAPDAVRRRRPADARGAPPLPISPAGELNSKT